MATKRVRLSGQQQSAASWLVAGGRKGGRFQAEGGVWAGSLWVVDLFSRETVGGRVIFHRVDRSWGGRTPDDGFVGLALFQRWEQRRQVGYAESGLCRHVEVNVEMLEVKKGVVAGREMANNVAVDC